jgi:hypothetical protein
MCAQLCDPCLPPTKMAPLFLLSQQIIVYFTQLPDSHRTSTQRDTAALAPTVSCSPCKTMSRRQLLRCSGACLLLLGVALAGPIQVPHTPLGTVPPGERYAGPQAGPHPEVQRRAQMTAPCRCQASALGTARFDLLAVAGVLGPGVGMHSHRLLLQRCTGPQQLVNSGNLFGSGHPDGAPARHG